MSMHGTWPPDAPQRAGVREVKKRPDARELLAQLRKFRGRLPADFKFDRPEANGRRPDR
jgi:antitoxin MazE